MANALIEARVTNLETMMADLMTAVAQTTRTVERLSLEMADFKNEMAAFKREMLEFKNEMSDFKREMADFKDEVHEYMERADRDRRNLNKQLGEIANKQGRMAEDLVAPSIGTILRKIEGYPETMPVAIIVRPRLIHPTKPGRSREFDTIAVCGDHLLVNETKSTLTPSDVKKVLKLIPEVREYVPQYKDKKVICSLATLYVDPSLVKHATNHGVLVLAVGDDLMDVMNPEGFKPKEH